MVCANGARFSNDPRVRVDRDELPYRHGWKWFVQVHRVSVLRTPNLYDLQKCVVVAISPSEFGLANQTLTAVGFLRGRLRCTLLMDDAGDRCAYGARPRCAPETKAGKVTNR